MKLAETIRGLNHFVEQEFSNSSRSLKALKSNNIGYCFISLVSNAG